MINEESQYTKGENMKTNRSLELNRLINEADRNKFEHGVKSNIGDAEYYIKSITKSFKEITKNANLIANGDNIVDTSRWLDQLHKIRVEAENVAKGK